MGIDTVENEDQAVTAEALKEKGNAAIKENKCGEAALYYTQAIKLDPDNYTLYSNRSFAYLKLQLYYLAFNDAQETISLNPAWPKGYFRKGEVEFATRHYNEAFESYKEALRLKPDDSNILQALNNTQKQVLRQRKLDKEIPWVGAGIGIIIGVFLLVAEYLTLQTLTHPLIMSFITIGMSLFGYVIAKFGRSYTKGQNKVLLEAPPNLEEEASPEDEKGDKRRTPRYTKSQARMRYKKGKA